MLIIIYVSKSLRCFDYARDDKNIIAQNDKKHYGHQYNEKKSAFIILKINSKNILNNHLKSCFSSGIFLCKV